MGLTELLHPVRGNLTWVGQWVREVAHAMPDGGARNSNEGTWFLHPEQHLVECAVAVVFVWVLLSRARVRPTGSAPAPAVGRRSLLDWAMAGGLFVSWAMMCYWKAISGLPRDPDTYERLWFMLMPCHLLTPVVGLLCIARGRLATLTFNLMLYWMHFPTLGLASPDTRDYKHFGEVEFYWVQHILLFLAPFVLLAERRFPLWKLDAAVACLAVAIPLTLFFHLFVAISFIRGINLNFMLSPPAAKALLMMGPYYRIGFSLTATVLCFISRPVMGLLADPLQRLAAAVGGGRPSKHKSG